MNEATDSTQESGSAGSISDDIQAAFASFEEAEASDTSIDTGDGDVDDTVDSVGDGVDEQASAEPQEADEAEEAAQETETSGIDAPAHWAEADRELFNNLPSDAKNFVLARHKSMEADYTRKMQDISDFRRDYEPIKQLLEPYKANLTQMGLTPAQYVNNLAQADLKLTHNPIEGLKDIARMYNIDISQLGSSESQGDDYADPEMQALRQELAELKGAVTQRQQAEQSERHNTILSEIQSFSEATNEAGELAHPYFNDVVDDMMVLAQAERQMGRNPVLKDLYDRAVWSNTSTRERMQAEVKAAQAKKAQEEARAKAAQARKASSSIKGSPVGDSPSGELSLREQLKESFG